MTRGAVVAIGGMAIVTYATRAAGLWLGNRLRIPRWFDSALAGLPGAILVSLAAPAIAAAGLAGIVAAAATVVAALSLRGNIVVPMAVGVLVVWAVRLV